MSSHSFNLVIIDQCLSEVFFRCYDICLQDDVTYNCTGIRANLITWTVPNLMGGTVELQAHQYHQYDTNGPFVAWFVLYQNNTIVSNLSFTA